MELRATESLALHVRRHVGWTDRSACGKIAFEGEDAATFLHGQLTQDIKSMSVGSGHWLALLDRKAKVQADMRLYRLDSSYLALLEASLVSHVLERLESVHFNEKVTLTDVTGQHTLLRILGRQSETLLQQTGATLPPSTPYAATGSRIGGVAVQILREDPAGGLLLLAAPDAKAALIEELTRAGETMQLVEYHEETAEVFRIEAGVPKHGVDFDDRNLLPELGRDEMVSATKGCYLGQEVVARVKTYGHVNRLLVGLVLDGAAVPPPGVAVISKGGAEVGCVTSAAFSAALGRPIALGLVKMPFAEKDVRLNIRAEGGMVGATVSELPFPKINE